MTNETELKEASLVVCRYYWPDVKCQQYMGNGIVIVTPYSLSSSKRIDCLDLNFLAEVWKKIASETVNKIFGMTLIHSENEMIILPCKNIQEAALLATDKAITELNQNNDRE